MQVFLILFLVCVTIQLLYLGWYLYAFSTYESNSSQEPVPVSVIVCAHDEEENLKELIPLLLDQKHPEFEVIVVEDRSNDNTFEFLHTHSHPLLKVVRIDHKPDHIVGKKFALTLGIKAAKYDWVLLTDADCRPKTNQWIMEMNRSFGEGISIVLGYSPYDKSSGVLNSFIRYETLLTAIQYIGMAILKIPYMGVGRNLAYKKSLFLKNKGFSTHLSVVGGDDDLFINKHSRTSKIGVCINEEAVVYSKPKTNWGDYFTQKIRHLAAGKKYRVADKLRLAFFNFSLIGMWLLFVPATLVATTVYLPLGAFLLRDLLLIQVSKTASRKMGEPFEAWKVPFLDFIFSIYYLVVGLIALQTHRIRWKKT